MIGEEVEKLVGVSHGGGLEFDPVNPSSHKRF